MRVRQTRLYLTKQSKISHFKPIELEKVSTTIQLWRAGIHLIEVDGKLHFDTPLFTHAQRRYDFLIKFKNMVGDITPFWVYDTSQVRTEYVGDDCYRIKVACKAEYNNQGLIVEGEEKRNWLLTQLGNIIVDLQDNKTLNELDFKRFEITKKQLDEI